jgi:hypothetical protein
MPNIPAQVYPSSLTWLGIGREAPGATGTPVAPTNLIPLDSGTYEPEDTPQWLMDEAIRYSMAKTFAVIQGPEDASFSYGGPVFGDVYGFFLDNAFGDMSTTGTPDATASTTLASPTVVGATTCTVTSGTGFAIAQHVQIGTGASAEVVTLSAVAGTALTFTTTPLRFAHAAAQAAVTVIGPYTHKWAILNADAGWGNGQPPTHTASDYTGITASVGARSYPSLAVSGLDFTGNAEQLFTAKVTGNSWVSAPNGMTPTPSTQFVVPSPAWRSTVTVGGSSVYDIGEWGISIKRDLKVYWTDQGAQNPFIIARGNLDATGTLAYSVAVNETPLTQMLANTQPAIVVTMDNGLAGLNQITFTFNLHAAAFIKAKPTRSEVLVGYEDEFTAVANSTDVGGSAGLGPMTCTLLNNVPTY